MTEILVFFVLFCFCFCFFFFFHLYASAADGRGHIVFRCIITSVRGYVRMSRS